MFRHALAAALRHLARTRLQAAIAVGGLAIGMAAALIAALVICNQLTFDRHVPGHERLYALVPSFSPPGLAPQYVQLTGEDFATRLRAKTGDIEASAVVYDDHPRVSLGTRLEREAVHWVDADFERLLPTRALAGDVAAALASPDALVLSRSAARRWFGEDAPLGRVLRINERTVTVRAVIADPPANATHEARHFLLSSTSQDSPQRRGDTAEKSVAGVFISGGYTYLRLRPGADPAALAALLPELVAPRGGGPPLLTLELVRLDRLHTHEGLNPGFAQRMQLLAILGALVFGVAAVNFVALQTARGALRAREVAIRKLAGAQPATLALQFLGEAVAWSLLGALLAVALTEVLLPQVNAFLDSGAGLNYRSDGVYLAGVLAAAIALGLLAGAWPALVLARLRPVGVLRGAAGGSREGVGRRLLVALQFAALIALAIAAGVAWRQREFAIRESLAADADQIVAIGVNGKAAFVDEIRRLAGVRAVTRVTLPLFGASGFRGSRAISLTSFKDEDGKDVAVTSVNVDLDLFAFYGVTPLAGRLPKPGEAAAAVPDGYVVINESALRRFGLASPEEALGKELPLEGSGTPDSPSGPLRARVLAVVPDFTFDTIASPVEPMVYQQPRIPPDVVFARVDGHRIPETLAAIDAAWKQTGEVEPPRRTFLDEMLKERYVGILRQSQAFGACAGIAVLLACIGLYGLTAAAAQRRTREIGLRKALGAEDSAILRLLLWQFTRPVLWGTLIAWTAAPWLMQRWLEGFAFHAELPLWLLPAASMAALAIAIVTVTGHALTIARTRPVQALRQE